MTNQGNPTRKAVALTDLTDKQQVGLDIYLTQVQPELDVSNHVLSRYGPTGHESTIFECPSCLVTDHHVQMCTCLYWHKTGWHNVRREVDSHPRRSEDR